MNLEIHGSRPASARNRVQINPITGEEMPFSARGTPRPDSRSRPHSRPDEVPALNLGKLSGGGPEEKSTKINLNPYEYKLDTPNTASTVSWGTPHSAVQKQHDDQQQQKSQNRYQNEHVHIGVIGGVPPAYNSARLYLNQDQTSGRQSASESARQKHQPTAFDKAYIPENLPPPPDKYAQQYAQYKQEMVDSYRAKSARPVTEQHVSDEMARLKLNLEGIDDSGSREEDDPSLMLTKTWTQQPYKQATLSKKGDVEELEREKRKNKLIETVMIDQLARAPMCDPEQNAVLSQRVPAYTPGHQRGSNRKLHDSRVKTSGTATENLLSRRVRFGARILTRDGRDAMRELTGFFFSVDCSLTIYEFRQFGKNAKALPFIKRGVYSHLYGRRKGEAYSLIDILQGGVLSFETRDQPIPDHLIPLGQIDFKITEVDLGAKADIMLEHVPNSEKAEVWKKLHLPPTEQETRDYLLVRKVQGLIHSQIRKRGIKVITGLGKLFRKLDENGDGKLNKYELEKALIDFHINIPDELFDDLWEILDYNGTSFLEYAEFMRGFLGEMHEDRKALVRKAYLKIDPAKKGYVSLDDLRKFYNAQKHPKVKAKECTAEEMLGTFVSALEFREHRDVVTQHEFSLYYEGLSVCVESDEDFANIVKNTWSV